MNQPVSNPNDFKVVSFHNHTDFGFTPEMGCMFDGRAINSPKGGLGIGPGETITLPYHIGHRLAVNLAKAVLVKGAPKDAPGVPTGVTIWDEAGLEKLKNSFLTDLYSEEKPTPQSATDILMEKIDGLNKAVEELKGGKKEEKVTLGYQDKAEVIAELDKRGVKYDKRKSKAELEKLLA